MEHVGGIADTHYGASTTRLKQHDELNLVIAQLDDFDGSQHGDASSREKQQAELNISLEYLGVFPETRHGAAPFLQSAFSNTKADAVTLETKSQTVLNVPMEHVGGIADTHHGASTTRLKQHDELNLFITQLDDIDSSQHGDASFREKQQAELNVSFEIVPKFVLSADVSPDGWPEKGRHIGGQKAECVTLLAKVLL